MTTPHTMRHRAPPLRQLSLPEETKRSLALPSPAALQYASTVSSTRATSKYIPISNFSYPASSMQPITYQDSSASSSILEGNWWKQRLYLFISLCVLATPWVRHSQIQWKVNMLHDELVQLQNDQQRLQSRMRTQTNALQKIKVDSERQHQTNDALLAQLRAHGDNYYDFDSEQYAQAEKLENAYFQRVDELEMELQRSADRLLVARGYGTPFRRGEAIRVEILLRHSVSTFGNRLVIQMGPLNSLSHAIELFLRMVEQKHFYDELTLMHRSAGSSSITTVPLHSETLQLVSGEYKQKDGFNLDSPGDMRPNASESDSIDDNVLMDQLAMFEKTEDFPVRKYSVLFADKGPHFYINMDNKPKKVSTETCFGVIVEGQAILDFMASQHDKNFRGLSMVGIESVRVIKPKEEDGMGNDPRFALLNI